MVKHILSYAVIAVMALLLAIDYHIFIIVNDFAPAGLNGIATMIQYKTGFSISYMSLLINIPLCIFAYFFCGKEIRNKITCFCISIFICISVASKGRPFGMDV